MALAQLTCRHVIASSKADEPKALEGRRVQSLAPRRDMQQSPDEAYVAPAAVGHHVLHSLHDIAVVLQPLAGGAARGRHATAAVVAAAFLQEQVVCAGLALSGYGSRGVQPCKCSVVTACLLPRDSGTDLTRAQDPSRRRSNIV